jgi:hypothetical protein
VVEVREHRLTSAARVEPARPRGDILEPPVPRSANAAIVALSPAAMPVRSVTSATYPRCTRNRRGGANRSSAPSPSRSPTASAIAAAGEAGASAGGSGSPASPLASTNRSESVGGLKPVPSISISDRGSNARIARPVSGASDQSTSASAA